MNPFTLGWYIPVIVNDLQGALQPSEAVLSASIAAQGHEVDDNYTEESISRGDVKSRKRRQPTLDDLDARFRADLPDELYLARLGFRALAMHACPRLTSLDGLVVGQPEREKARKLLQGLNSTKYSAQTTSTAGTGGGVSKPMGRKTTNRRQTPATET
jgi:protein NUD1